jgi:hypothetical protein
LGRTPMFFTLFLLSLTVFGGLSLYGLGFIGFSGGYTIFIGRPASYC